MCKLETWYSFDAMSSTVNMEDLFGLDKYQEHARVVGLLPEVHKKLEGWFESFQLLENRRQLHHELCFGDIDGLLQQYLKDICTILDELKVHKRKHREECKKVHDSIHTSVVVATPVSSNPEAPPPPLVSEEVLQEGNAKKTKRRRKLIGVSKRPEKEEELLKEQEEAERMLQQILQGQV